MAVVGGLRSALSLLFFAYLPSSQCHVFAENQTWNRTVDVSPEGNDSSSCGSENSPCKTIDQGLQNAITRGASSTRVRLKSGEYNLSTSFNFTNIENFSIYGEGSANEVNITCAENTSLAFLIVKNLVLKGFTLRKCGDWHASSVGKQDWRVPNPNFITAVFINYCYGLQILSVRISETPGLGINAYAVSGQVLIENSTFDQNVPTDKNQTDNDPSEQDVLMVEPSGHYARSGGGMFISAGIMKCNPLHIPEEVVLQYTKPMDVVIRNCTFTGNIAPTPEKEVPEVTTLPFSHGGGLAIFLMGNSTDNRVFIDSSVFSNNKAVWGGGLQIDLQSKTQNNTVMIKNTVFRNNSAKAEGGGFRLSSTVEEDLRILPNAFHFILCQIINNSALWGGGFTTYGATFQAPFNRLTKYKHTEIILKSCVISGNTGTVGSAIGAFLVNRNEDDIGPGVPYNLVFDHCNISNNNVITASESYVVGQGAVYSDEVPLIFKNNVTISFNNGTAVVLDSAVVEIHNHVLFEHNTGSRGGALSIYGNSRVILMKYSRLSFLSNFCDEKGGALYVEAPGPPLVSFNANGAQIHKCFLAYEDDSVLNYSNWQTEILFQNNSVGDKSFHENSSGRSAFVSTLRDCLSVGESRENNTAMQWDFIKYKDESGQNASFPGQVVTEPIDISFNATEWNVAPSQVFNATIKLIDEKKNNVYGIIQVLVQSDPPSVKLKGTSALFLVYNSIRGLTIEGKPGSTFIVELKTTGKHLVHKTIFNLTVQPCFPGYHFQDNECVCSSVHLRGIYNCSDDGKTVFIRDGYWAGVVNDEFLTYLCPDTYCRTNALSDGQSQAYKYEPSKMCIESRKRDGILCGACKANYTVLLGSEKCSSECSNFYLLTIIPYGIVLFLVVMVVTLINLDVFTGYLNAWLYSFQVMNLLFVEGFTLDSFMQFVVGLANIKIKTGGSCFMEKMDDADKLVIMYILPVYIFLAVYILAKVVRKYPNWCYSRRVKAPFRALCTLFVLCYTNITSITIKLLYPATIGGKTVMFMDGQVEFFKGKHIAYAIIAIFFLVFIVIPCPLILMFTPFFTKLLRPCVNVFTLKPYYDAFQGCFKDEYRWCSAFYFVCRLYLILVSTYMHPSPWKRALLEDSCMCILAVFVYLKPYKEEYNWLNLLDAVLLSNLGVMAIFSTALQNAQSFGPSYIETFEVVIHVLSYVPLCYLACLLIYQAFKYRELLKAYITMKMKMREDSALRDGYSDVEPQSLVADLDVVHQMENVAN